MKDKRIVSLDILRIISALSVIMLHVCGSVIYAQPIDNVNFKIANFMDSLSRFGVPIFVMISGAIFLSPDKQVNVKRLWSKNILRMVVAFFFWGYLYYDLDNVLSGFKKAPGRSAGDIIRGILTSDEYLWFILMIAVIYALIPVIRTWTGAAGKKGVEYFLVLFAIFTVVQNSIVIMADKSLLLDLSNKFNLGQKIGYFGFFVLGHYLNEYGLSKKLTRIVYATVPFDIAINYATSAYMTGKKGYYHSGIYDSFGIFTALEIVALFVFVTNACNKRAEPDKKNWLLSEMAACTFGIYLMHELILRYMSLVWKDASWLYIIPTTLALFLISCIITFVLRRIPIVGKYIC